MVSVLSTSSRTGVCGGAGLWREAAGPLLDMPKWPCHQPHECGSQQASPARGEDHPFGVGGQAERHCSRQLWQVSGVGRRCLAKQDSLIVNSSVLLFLPLPLVCLLSLCFEGQQCVVSLSLSILSNLSCGSRNLWACSLFLSFFVCLFCLGRAAVVGFIFLSPCLSSSFSSVLRD